MKQEMLEKYARLIVQVGANVQKGQPVRILAAVDQYAFANLVVEECYKAGASLVSVEWSSTGTDVLHYTYADTAVLSAVPAWQVEKMKYISETLPCSIYIDSDDPDGMNSVDPDKLAAVMRERTTVMKPYRNAMDGKYQWLIVAVPSPKWAAKLFPNDTVEDAIEKLWQAIFATTYVSEDNDPVAVRREHDRKLCEKAAWMNENAFSSLRYHSANGTDFTVELIPGAKWDAAMETNPVNGAVYVPNMPTEEVFTSPIAGKCEGTLVASKPLSWNGVLIDGFSIDFKDGKAVSCKAEVGQAALEKIIHMDETSCMLGEVALVPKESPVNQCGFLFFNTLFDENAACHVALGHGFKEVLPNGNDLTVEEAQALGINDSLIHVDFMIGTDDLSVIGIKPDGTEVPVFVNGTWA